MTISRGRIISIVQTEGCWRAHCDIQEGKSTNRRPLAWALVDSMTEPVDERLKVISVVVGDDGQPTLEDRCGQVKAYNSSADLEVGMAKALP